ncbi:Hypothetical predicted protein [Marmota monax]|uniref:G-protein coupled receptors family 1 profile domain-containing protein n=1 Tax=Marmota monax TaxID=9995 RepID=A0A5E4AJK5_MARMO|nr:Hypothetical predicted protein [Marmota monax]
MPAPHPEAAPAPRQHPGTTLVCRRSEVLLALEKETVRLESTQDVSRAQLARGQAGASCGLGAVRTTTPQSGRVGGTAWRWHRTRPTRERRGARGPSPTRVKGDDCLPWRVIGLTVVTHSQTQMSKCTLNTDGGCWSPLTVSGAWQRGGKCRGDIRVHRSGHVSDEGQSRASETCWWPFPYGEWAAPQERRQREQGPCGPVPTAMLVSCCLGTRSRDRTRAGGGLPPSHALLLLFNQPQKGGWRGSSLAEGRAVHTPGHGHYCPPQRAPGPALRPLLASTYLSLPLGHAHWCALFPVGPVSVEQPHRWGCSCGRDLPRPGSQVRWGGLGTLTGSRLGAGGRGTGGPGRLALCGWSASHCRPGWPPAQADAHPCSLQINTFMSFVFPMVVISVLNTVIANKLTIMVRQAAEQGRVSTVGAQHSTFSLSVEPGRIQALRHGVRVLRR